jgi:para-nitrobenzyl esterase
MSRHGDTHGPPVRRGLSGASGDDQARARSITAQSEVEGGLIWSVVLPNHPEPPGRGCSSESGVTRGREGCLRNRLPRARPPDWACAQRRASLEGAGAPVLRAVVIEGEATNPWTLRAEASPCLRHSHSGSADATNDLIDCVLVSQPYRPPANGGIRDTTHRPGYSAANHPVEAFSRERNAGPEDGSADPAEGLRAGEGTICTGLSQLHAARPQTAHPLTPCLPVPHDPPVDITWSANLDMPAKPPTVLRSSRRRRFDINEDDQMRAERAFPRVFRNTVLRAGLVAAAVVAFGSLVLAGSASEATPSPVERQTRFGRVIGADDSGTTGTYAWKGVPFAKPPVGDLRWKAPADPDPWHEPKLTQHFGNACAQYGRIYGPGANNRHDETIAATLNQAVGHEDCLYLNIWRPATPQGGLPVILFVHGGSNVSGYTADPVYDGGALAKAANAVVVTVNYRLGILGFLNLPQLKTGTDPIEDSGDFALLDIIKALEFVRQNIAHFGGKPGNVTLMGQSAGAINVYAMLTSPLVVDARPQLFHRAVPLSGGISLASNLPPGRLPTLLPASVYLAQGNALLVNRVIDDSLATDTASALAYIATQTPAQIAAYLRSKSPAALFQTLLTKLAPLGLAGSGPIPDGAVLPENPIGAIEAGDYLKVPVLAGNTRDEGKSFPTFLTLFGGPSGRLVNDATLFLTQFHYDPNAAPAITIDQWIHPFYLPVDTPGTGFNARTELLNQIFFIASRDNVLNALRAQQPQVWYYRFDWDQEPAPWNDIYGAAHAFDLPFGFGNFGPSLFSNIANSDTNEAGRLALSQAMMQSLGAFARHGDPNTGSLGGVWPAWPSTLVFDATDTVAAISVE